ncbi:MAG: hypothetical protein ACPGNT_07815 [Rhodospirillales bacterium]
MEPIDFTPEELDLFAKLAERVGHWHGCQVEHTPEGRHVMSFRIEPSILGSDCEVVRIAKALPGKYVARGLSGWDLLVCDSLDQLFDVILAGAGCSSVSSRLAAAE